MPWPPNGSHMFKNLKGGNTERGMERDKRKKHGNEMCRETERWVRGWALDMEKEKGVER